ncbi:cadmium resistance transporter [Streptomyces sp. NPDC052101]|uniref:cadmium resistance transporter n=1 Tax=Streptomyces sp. NPDC052101 TaxID=3155763 RepID=UPI0034351993
MTGMLGTAGTAVVMFAGTNVDDLVVVTVLFLASRTDGRPATREIWAGQYAGLALLSGVSFTAALGLATVSEGWLGLLGLVAFGLGVRGLVAAVRGGGRADEATRGGGTMSVTLLTVVTGTDNISVYTPAFRVSGPAATAVILIVFAAGVAVWCLAGAWLSSRASAAAAVERQVRWVVPCVFIAAGAVVMATTAGRLL